MNQKRLNQDIEYKDVCLKENNKKRQKRIYAFLMNCAAPLLTVIFLAGSVCWAAEMQYGDSVEYDSNPEAAAVLSPRGVVEGETGFVETRLPESGIAVTENIGAELVEACGVYIEEELDLLLEDYREDENIIEADYAVETDLKQGVYRSAALVSMEDMTDYLTGEKEVVKEYTADDGDTAEKLAEDFDMSVEDIKELNPEIEDGSEDLKEGESVRVKETVSVLPVKYTCEVTEEEELDYEILMAGGFYSGDDAVKETGEKGKRISRYEVTYIDGVEVSRKLKESETILEPVVETFEAEVDDEGLYTESIPVTASEAATGSFIWPVNGGYVSDPFMSDRSHKGMDIAADSGTDIYAADGGTVIDAGWNDGGYGNYVMIDHGNGYVTLYGHASEVYVSAGDIVSAGDVIAAVGTTGDSTGNHCHFEIRYDGGYLNPASFIGG